MVRWDNSLSMTFRCSNGIRQGGQLSPLLYNSYTDDLNHHLQATGVGRYVGGSLVNSLRYADEVVSLAPTVTALQILLEVCRAYAGPHDIAYNTRKTVCMLVRPKQSQGRYSTIVMVGNEELVFVKKFRCLGHVLTADCRDDKDIKKQFRRQNAVGNMLVRKFSFAHIEAKIQLFKSYCYPIYGCALWHYSHKNSIRKLTASYSDTFTSLINVSKYTSSSLAFTMNTTDHINVVFRKFACSLMSRVTVSPNCIVTAIVNSKAYHRSPLMDKWESMLYTLSGRTGSALNCHTRGRVF